MLRELLERLRGFTVLDPACGSGNFLYLALHALKDLEHRVQLEAEAMGLQRSFPAVGPANMRGIELNGEAVGGVNADLTAAGTADLGRSRRLEDNRGVSFMGDTKNGAFDVSGDLAREWLRLPGNPNGRGNAAVLKPWMNGMDVTRRPAGKWIIDFGSSMSESEAALYEAPFRHVETHVKPARARNRGRRVREYWWLHEAPGRACGGCSRASRATSRRRPWRSTGCSSGSTPVSALTIN